MVRRRTRACATSKAPVDLMANGGGGGSAVVLATASQLLEDQYFASPKRKDCKVEDSTYDEGAHSSGGSSPTTIQNEDAVALRAKLKSTSPNKLKGGINGRAIGKCRLSIYWILLLFLRLKKIVYILLPHSCTYTLARKHPLSHNTQHHCRRRRHHHLP